VSARRDPLPLRPATGNAGALIAASCQAS